MGYGEGDEDCSFASLSRAAAARSCAAKLAADASPR